MWKTSKLLNKFKNNINIYFQRILSSFVIFFCFLLFPLFLAYTAFDVYFVSNIDNLKTAKLAEMDSQIDYLNKYSNNYKYLHYLLSKISDYAQKADNPTEYLKINIDNLKKRYPEGFQFFVWDENGKIVKDVSDKTAYSYVLNKIYECLNEVTNTVLLNPNINIAEIKSVKKNINILQRFFGRLFISSNLKKPVYKGSDAGPILTELGRDFSFTWFSIREKVSFLCFISSKLIKDFDGLKKISGVLSNNTDIIYGFSVSPEYEKAASKFPVEYEPELALALASFENGGESIFENDKSIVKMFMPQPNVRTFGFLSKRDELWNYKVKRNFWFGIFCFVLMLIYSLLGFWFLYKKHFFSISWKLTALFLIANLVPILILVFITNKYIDNKRISLKNEVTDELERTMREFDLQYNYSFEKISSNIISISNDIFEKVGNEPIKEKEKNQVLSMFNELNPSALFLIASSGEIILSRKGENTTTFSSNFVSRLGKTSLDYLNNKPTPKVSAQETDVFASVFEVETSEFFKNFLKNTGNVRSFFLGHLKQLFFFYTFGKKEIYNNNYLLMLIWNNDIFQNLFLNENYNTLCKKNSDAVFCIKTNLEETFFGPSLFKQKMNTISQKNFGNSDKIIGNIEIDGKNNVFVCLKGKNLENITMTAFYPEYLINKKIYSYIVQVILGAFISLLLTIIIGQMVTFQFLKPIENIGKAAGAINDHNFSYRVPIEDKDEFGRLSLVFNRVIEGLEDFEVAKIIQESLLPGNHFNVGDFDIFARTVVMTTLGGDYYDCFKINDNYFGMIIGDVAGHGIPAGLMMAMAKSAVLSAPEEIKLDPTALTSRLHKMFFSIKNERLKRMMTFQYFVLNVKEGHFIYTNAGHCFPVIVDNNTKKAFFMDYIATPLGIGPRCRCKNQEFNLDKGQSLVLYTDGIVEANNAEKEQYGYDRFIECLPRNYDINPETFYYNLYNKVYKNWVASIDDDLSLILINRV